MRILHTADWHLGRTLKGRSLLEDQAWVLDQILSELENGYDALIIAGDVFDRAIPPPDAVSLFSFFLDRALSHERLQVLVSPGNHDSAQRLSYADTLLERTGLHLRCDFKRLGEPVLLRDTDGVEVEVFMLPFVETGVVRDQLADRSIGDHLSATEACLERMRAVRSPQRPGVLVAHAYVVDGKACDSERDLFLGPRGLLPTGLFAGFDYVALGHLHQPQTLRGEDVVLRYSGSILPYSFSEAQDRKELVRLTWNAGRGSFDSSSIPLRPLHPMRVLQGTFDELTDIERYPRDDQAYLLIRLQDPQQLFDAYARLRDQFPLLLDLQLPAVTAAASGDEQPVLQADDPETTLRRFVESFLPDDEPEALEVLNTHLGKAMRDPSG